MDSNDAKNDDYQGIQEEDGDHGLDRGHQASHHQLRGAGREGGGGRGKEGGVAVMRRVGVTGTEK